MLRQTKWDCLYVMCAALLVYSGAPASEPAAGVASTVDDVQTIAEVVVTGSRIPVSLNAEVLPVTVLDATDLARGGSDSLSKILQALPMSASSVLNTNVNASGDGSARVDLRALQPWRTLVLLNGHRLPEGGVGGDLSVDLNSLPVPMIERVEVLTSGASAIYGADAVSGVVNLITKSKLDGVDFNAEQSQASRSDGRITTLNLTAGREVLGGHWMVGGDYVHQAGVLQSARPYAAQPSTILDSSGLIIPFGSETIPEGLFDVPNGNKLGLPAGLYTHVNGTTGYSAADYRPWHANDTFDFAPYAYLQTPNERSSFWLIGTQPLSPTVSLHVEGLYNHRVSSQQLAPAPFSNSTTIPAANYYNPFGTDLDFVDRRFVELPARVFRQQVDLNRELASLSFTVGRWTIEPAVSISRSSATVTNIAAIPGDRLNAALGPSAPDAAGQIVCGAPAGDGIVPASAVVPGCVPIDVFGGVGSLTPRQLASLPQTLTDYGTNGQQIGSIDARGPWGTLPAGELQWAAGVEYRRDQGSYTFDPDSGGGAVGGDAAVNTPNVSITAREAYLEMRAPLVRQRPWAEVLEAAAGIRYSNYSSFGGHLTWQGGIRWQAAPAVTVRSSYARVFRAPALVNLYLAPSVSQDLEFDPCGNNPTPAQKVHCGANGVPGGEYTQPAINFNVPTGGNPKLGPESGYSFDSGVDLRPDSLPNFHASLDLYQINLNNSIHIPSDADILQECADAGRADICGLIRRAANGTILAVSELPINIGNEKVAGVDLAASLAKPLGPGHIKLNLQGSYLARHDTQLFPGGVVFHEADSYSMYDGALPHWRSLAHVDWDNSTWHLSYSAQWIGSYAECAYLRITFDPYCRRVAKVVYHDAEGAYTLASMLTVRVGVNNLTNRQPPFLNYGNEANTDTYTYRLLGRTFFVALHLRLP